MMVIRGRSEGCCGGGMFIADYCVQEMSSEEENVQREAFCGRLGNRRSLERCAGLLGGNGQFEG